MTVDLVPMASSSSMHFALDSLVLISIVTNPGLGSDFHCHQYCPINMSENPLALCDNFMNIDDPAGMPTMAAKSTHFNMA